MKSTQTNSKKFKDGKQYVCETCGKTFKYKSALDTHIRVHTGEKPFKCDVCPFACIKKVNLFKHKKIHS